MYSKGKLFIFSNGNFPEFFGWRWGILSVSNREFPVALIEMPLEETINKKWQT